MPSDSGKAVLYLRSSKDRSDVSPAAQRHALEALATSRSLQVVATFEDAAIGSSDPRPAFDELVLSIKDPARTWSNLLVYDSSRIVRGRYFAVVFKHDLKKRGITLHYATRPADLDPVSALVLDAVLEAMDEVHSIMSRQRGLAGMAENVRRGFRAGGRAPVGYRLKSIPTGAVRDGKPVMKSRLEPSEIAHQVRAYLRGRIRGTPRVIAREMAGLVITDTSLIGMEWNALTYAGHTVWNVHREAGSGSKRRPRSEWQMKRDTHEALITEREAESLLAALETSDVAAAKRAAIAARSNFLLAGLLHSTDGRAWLGHGAHYRLRRADGRPGRIIPAAKVDQAVIEAVNEYRTSDEYLEWLLAGARAAEAPRSPTADLAAQIRRLERERARAAEQSLAEGASGVYTELVVKRGRQIDQLRRELAAVERESSAETGVRNLAADDLRELIEAQDPIRVVKQLVGRVVLEPDLTCQVHLGHPSQNRLWRDMASPKGFEYPPQGKVLIAKLAA